MSLILTHLTFGGKGLWNSNQTCCCRFPFRLAWNLFLLYICLLHHTQYTIHSKWQCGVQEAWRLRSHIQKSRGFEWRNCNMLYQQKDQIIKHYEKYWYFIVFAYPNSIIQSCLHVPYVIFTICLSSFYIYFWNSLSVSLKILVPTAHNVISYFVRQ